MQTQITKKLSTEQLQDIKETFDTFDKDKDGSITTKELGSVIKSMGQNVTETEIQEMINEMDTNGDGIINFEEFSNQMAKKMMDIDSSEELKDAFKVIDSDQNGLISEEELKLVFEELEEDIGEEDVRAMLEDFGKDSQGFVNYEEFHKMMFN